MENASSFGSEEPHQARVCGHGSGEDGTRRPLLEPGQNATVRRMGLASLFGPHLHTSSRPASHNALLLLCIIESPGGVPERRRGLAIKGSGVVRSTGASSKTLVKD